MPKIGWRRSPEPKSSEPNVLLGPGMKTLDKVYRVGYTPTIDPSERLNRMRHLRHAADGLIFGTMLGILTAGTCLLLWWVMDLLLERGAMVGVVLGAGAVFGVVAAVLAVLGGDR